MVTVIDRFRALRVEPHKNVTWAVGDAVMRKYVKEYARQPPKCCAPRRTHEDRIALRSTLWIGFRSSTESSLPTAQKRSGKATFSKVINYAG